MRPKNRFTFRSPAFHDLEYSIGLQVLVTHGTLRRFKQIYIITVTLRINMKSFRNKSKEFVPTLILKTKAQNKKK